MGGRRQEETRWAREGGLRSGHRRGGGREQVEASAEVERPFSRRRQHLDFGDVVTDVVYYVHVQVIGRGLQHLCKSLRGISVR